MNAVIYARYSSHNQREESIEGQLKECHAFAKKNGYTVVREYIDRALSGTSDARPDFLRMIDDSGKKIFDFVIVYQLDRFARNRYDSATYKAKLKKNGVRVLSARENITDDASGILVEGLLESMAEYYSAELAQKIKRGMNINAEKCLANGSNPGLGYKVGPDKRYILDPETAPIVARIFEEYAAGKPVIEICESLNNQGYKTSKGGAFNKNSLHRMLNNRRYLGIYVFNGRETPGGMPRIVSDELFDKVQSILKKNKKAPAHSKAKQEYILTTKLFCGKCREMMTGIKGNSHTGKVYHYYKCNAAKRKQCSKKTVQKEYIEDLVISECRKLLTAENIDKIAREVVALCEREKDNSNLRRIEKLIRDNERKQKNLMNALGECEIESVRRSLYTEIANLSEEHDALKNELAIEKAGSVSLTISEVKFFLSQLKKGDVDDLSYRKTLVNVFVNAIYLYDDKMTIYFNSGDKPVTIDGELVEQVEASEGFVFRPTSSTTPETPIDTMCQFGVSFFMP
jgi:DNA invertase Pin-like site-specific DNA recombinase